jgi:hypothetical protein
MTESRPGAAADYAQIAAWLDENEQMSDICRAGLLPGGSCAHD